MRCRKVSTAEDGRGIRSRLVIEDEHGRPIADISVIRTMVITGAFSKMLFGRIVQDVPSVILMMAISCVRVVGDRRIASNIS